MAQLEAAVRQLYCERTGLWFGVVMGSDLAQVTARCPLLHCWTEPWALQHSNLHSMDRG